MHRLLDGIEAVITYRPFSEEVDAAAILSLRPGLPTYVIEPRGSLDPLTEAEAAIRLAGSRHAAIFMPGTLFDITGTRQGRGGGWYDRFLTQVPDGWMRIGFCFSDQFSPAMLVRREWDQPVDHVCVIDRSNGTVTCHKTNARPLLH